MNAHKKTAARFTAISFGIVVLAISASTSFAFFYNYFSNLIPPGVLGEGISALISGVVGTLLFDVASVVWLQTYLNDARTPEQRAISLIMLIITFLGAAAASVAHLALSATGELALDAATLDTIATISLVTVIVGVIFNFGSTIAYQRYSQENKESVRESDRSDAVQRAEDDQLNELDRQLDKEVRDILAGMVPGLARQQAERIATQVARREGAKYGGNEAATSAFEIQDGSSGRWKTIRRAPTLADAKLRLEGLSPGLYRIIHDGEELYSTRRPQPSQEVRPSRPTPAVNDNGRNQYQPE